MHAPQRNLTWTAARHSLRMQQMETFCAMPRVRLLGMVTSLSVTSILGARAPQAMIVGSIISALSVACSALDPPTANIRTLAAGSFPLQSGDTDFNDRGAVAIMTHRAGAASLCSGALISSKVLLTARHCLATTPIDTVQCGQSLGPTVSPSVVEVTTAVTSDSSLTDDAGRAHAVEQIRVVPGGDDPCGFDLALLVLADPTTPTEALPFEPTATQPFAFQPYSALGYGETCGDASDERCYLGSGVRRRLNGLTVACADDCPRNVVAATEWAGERGPCLGDSGGPALDDQGRLLGVAVRGAFDATGNCITPVYAAVLPWRSFLAQVVGEVAESAHTNAPSWATVLDASTEPADVEGKVMAMSDGGHDEQSDGAAPKAADGFVADAQQLDRLERRDTAVANAPVGIGDAGGLIETDSSAPAIDLGEATGRGADGTMADVDGGLPSASKSGCGCSVHSRMRNPSSLLFVILAVIMARVRRGVPASRGPVEG